MSPEPPPGQPGGETQDVPPSPPPQDAQPPRGLGDRPSFQDAVAQARAQQSALQARNAWFDAQIQGWKETFRQARQAGIPLDDGYPPGYIDSFLRRDPGNLSIEQKQQLLADVRNRAFFANEALAAQALPELIDEEIDEYRQGAANLRARGLESPPVETPEQVAELDAAARAELAETLRDDVGAALREAVRGGDILPIRHPHVQMVARALAAGLWHEKNPGMPDPQYQVVLDGTADKPGLRQAYADPEFRSHLDNAMVRDAEGARPLAAPEEAALIRRMLGVSSPADDALVADMLRTEAGAPADPAASAALAKLVTDRSGAPPVEEGPAGLGAEVHADQDVATPAGPSEPRTEVLTRFTPPPDPAEDPLVVLLDEPPPAAPDAPGGTQVFSEGPGETLILEPEGPGSTQILEPEGPGSTQILYPEGPGETLVLEAEAPAPWTPPSTADYQAGMAAVDALDLQDQIAANKATLDLLQSQGVDVGDIAAAHGVDLGLTPDQATAPAYAESLIQVVTEAMDQSLAQGIAVDLPMTLQQLHFAPTTTSPGVSALQLGNEDIALIQKAWTMQRAIENGDLSNLGSESYLQVRQQLQDKLAEDLAGFTDKIANGVQVVVEPGPADPETGEPAEGSGTVTHEPVIGEPEDFNRVFEVAGVEPPPMPGPHRQVLLEPTFGARPGLSGEVPVAATPDVPTITAPDAPELDAASANPPQAPESVSGGRQAVAPPDPARIRQEMPAPPRVEVQVAPPQVGDAPQPPPVEGDGTPAPPPSTEQGGPTATGPEAGTARQDAGGSGGVDVQVRPRPGGATGEPEGTSDGGPEEPTEGEPDGPPDEKPPQPGAPESKGSTGTEKKPGASFGATISALFQPGADAQIEAAKLLESQGLTDVVIERSGGSVRITATAPDGTRIDVEMSARSLARGTAGTTTLTRIVSAGEKLVHGVMIAMLIGDAVKSLVAIQDPETTWALMEKFAALIRTASGGGDFSSAAIGAGLDFVDALKRIFGPTVTGIPVHPLWIGLFQDVGLVALIDYLETSCDKQLAESLYWAIRQWVQRQRDLAAGRTPTGGPFPPAPWKPGPPPIDETTLDPREHHGRRTTGPTQARDHTLDNAATQDIGDAMHDAEVQIDDLLQSIRADAGYLAKLLDELAHLDPTSTGYPAAVEQLVRWIGIVQEQMRRDRVEISRLRKRIATGRRALRARGQPAVRVQTPDVAPPPLPPLRTTQPGATGAPPAPLDTAPVRRIREVVGSAPPARPAVGGATATPGGGGPPPGPEPPQPPQPPPPVRPPEPPPTPTGTRGPTTGPVSIGAAAAVIGLGVGLLGGIGLTRGETASGGQPTSAVGITPLEATPAAVTGGPTTTAPPPQITGVTARANSSGNVTEYAATATGTGPLTYYWGWARNPGCGHIENTLHGPTTFATLADCPPATEATVDIVVCAQGPTGVSLARRSARYGDENGQTDPVLVENGLTSEGFSVRSGAGDCAALIAGGGDPVPPSSEARSTTEGPALAGAITAGTAVDAAAASGGANGAAVAEVAAGSVVFAGGVFIVRLRRKPRKDFVNKCSNGACGGCPRSQHCGAALTQARANKETTERELTRAEQALQDAKDYLGACQQYEQSVVASANQLDWIIPQMQAYLDAVTSYIDALQKAMALDEQLMSLHGVDAADLSGSPRPGWVEVRPNLYAKDEHTANMARAAGGVDQTQVQLDWAAKNTQLITALNQRDDAQQNLDEWTAMRDDLREHIIPDAQQRTAEAEHALEVATRNEDTAIDADWRAANALEEAENAYAACQAALMAALTAWADSVNAGTEA